jgi:hypothetical protein
MKPRQRLQALTAVGEYENVFNSKVLNQPPMGLAAAIGVLLIYASVKLNDGMPYKGVTQRCLIVVLS